MIRSRSGNVLFIILIAVSLFAALSYAISDASRGGSIGNEKASIFAAEIMEYGTAMKAAVQKVVALNNCADTDISFENNVESGYEHGGAGAPEKCKIFGLHGGKMRWKQVDEKWMDPANYTYETWFFPRNACVQHIGIDGTDGVASNLFCDNAPEAHDLMIVLPGIKQSVCAAINKKISGDPAIPVDNSKDFDNRKFAGSYDGGIAPEIGDLAGILQGQTQYCFQSGTGYLFPNGYNYYQVLLAR